MVARLIHLAAPMAAIANFKVLPAQQKPRQSYVIKAIRHCMREFPQYRVVNVSLSFPPGWGPFRCREGHRCKLCIAVNEAAESGLHVVVAAGNEGPHLNTITCPGNAEGALTVAATLTKKASEWWDSKAWFRRWWLKQSGWFGRHFGTSYSTAYVSGGIALIFAALSDARPQELRQCIREVGYRSPGMQTWEAGAGQVNWENVVACLMGGSKLEKSFPKTDYGTTRYQEASDRIYWVQGNEQAQRPNNRNVTDALEVLLETLEKLAAADQTEIAPKEAQQILSYLIPGQLPAYEERLRTLAGRLS